MNVLIVGVPGRLWLSSVPLADRFRARADSWRGVQGEGIAGTLGWSP